MITIGAFYGGPELVRAPIDLLVTATMQAAEEVCGTWEEINTPRVNVNFCVPGSLEKYEFLTKADVARFTRKRRAIAVRVPVPKELVSTGGSVQFIVESLLAGVQLAAEAFERKGIEGFDLSAAEEKVHQIAHLVTEKISRQNT